MIAFAGHNRTYTVPTGLVATLGTTKVTGWDLLNIAANREDAEREDAADWADGILDGLLEDLEDSAEATLDCDDCPDVGFYAIEDESDPDTLVSLIKRGTDGYDQFTASGWVGYDLTESTAARIISREIAADLASVIASGGSGLVLRYVEPLAWLPPSNDIEVTPITAAVDKSTDGWINYAIVDDLDLGAVLNLIRLKAGPQLEAMTATGWQTDDHLLSQLRGVDPPVLVELTADQFSSVEPQVVSALQAQAAKKKPGAGGGTVAAAVSAKARKKAADKGQALPDGSYPIRNKTDLSNAVQSYGRAKNKAKVKRHIIKRARALGAVSELPQEWGITASLTADGFPENQTCEYCDEPATQRIIHSEGMAYIPVCDDHLSQGEQAAAACVPSGEPDPDNIVRIEVITAASIVSPLPGVSPDPRAEKLRRYWSIGGRGGAKIRWGTKGDWKRCYRHLAKFMGPRAKGYCQNLHKRNTGLWTGSRFNASGAPEMSTEEALAAAITSGTWRSDTGRVTDMLDGVYTEAGDVESELLTAVVAGGFPVAPPDEWFTDPQLKGNTPLTVEASGRVYGHIATWDMAHIGLPGKVHAPKNRSGYSYFKTGEMVTASGARVPVGNLTLAGGHAPLSADAGAAVAHYDNTASAIADVNIGEDKYGIWVAGALRPEAKEEQIRALRASAPSGDWRPINGNLELVAICQVNVPGFPVTRARVASGAIMALVAAGARPLAEQRLMDRANESFAARLAQLEAIVADLGGPGVIYETDEAPMTVLDSGPVVGEVAGESPVEDEQSEAADEADQGASDDEQAEQADLAADVLQAQAAVQDAQDALDALDDAVSEIAEDVASEISEGDDEGDESTADDETSEGDTSDGLGVDSTDMSTMAADGSPSVGVIFEFTPKPVVADATPDGQIVPDVTPEPVQPDAPETEVAETVPVDEGKAEVTPEASERIQTLRAEIAAKRKREALRMRVHSDGQAVAAAASTDSREALRQRVHGN